MEIVLNNKTMETKTNGNDFAFARASFYHADGGYDSPQKGLSIRGYYSGMAMVGLLASSHNSQIHNTKEGAQVCVEWADSLIKELNKDKNSDVSILENTDREPEIGDMVFAWDSENPSLVGMGILTDIQILGEIRTIYVVGEKSHWKYCSLKNPLVK